MTAPLFRGGSVFPLPDQGYYHVLLDRVETARERIWAAVFLIDLLPRRDRGVRVRRLVRALQAARWRGVDVRILLSRSAQSLNVDITSQVALRYLQSRRLAARPYQPSGRLNSLHAKLVVVDGDTVLVGSHNWTRQAFAADVEDSVLVRSPELNGYLADRFIDFWGE